MPGEARLTDIGVGVCVCHEDPEPMVGMLMTSAVTVFAETLPNSRLTDVMVGSCGHCGIVCTSALTVFSESLPNARMADVFSGCFTGTIATSAVTVFDEGG